MKCISARGLTFSVIYFIYHFSCEVAAMVIKKEFGQF